MSVSTTSIAYSREEMACCSRPASWVGVLLFALLALKIVAQHYLFIGLTNGEYLEEHIFHYLARSIVDGGSYFANFEKWAAIADWSSWKGDPIDMYPFRVSALLPNSFFVALLGPSEYSLTLYSMICGIGTMIVVFGIGKELVHPVAGLYSATALAIFPPHLIYSSRMNTDMPQLFFLGLMVYFLVCALRRNSAVSNIFALLSGVSAGLTYMSKLPLGVLALGCAVALCLLCTQTAKRRVHLVLFLVLGFGVVFCLENLWYYHLSGKWFLHWHVMHGNQSNLTYWKAGADAYDFGPIVVWMYKNGILGLFEYLRIFLGAHTGGVYNVPLFGWYFPAVVFAAVSLMVFRKLDRVGAGVLIGFLAYYFYLELACVFPFFEDGVLQLVYYHKNHRFLIPLSIGMCLTIGIALFQLQEWLAHKQAKVLMSVSLPTLLIALMSVGSIWPMTVWFPKYRDSYRDLRKAAHFLEREVPPGGVVYVEPDLKLQFRTFTRDYPLSIKYLAPQTTLSELCEGWLVMGGSHGMGVSPHIFPSWLPPILIEVWREHAPAPRSWTKIYQDPEPVSPLKPRLRIYKLPSCEISGDPTDG